MEQAPPLPGPEAPVWALTDGHAGNVRQALALARGLAAGWPTDTRLGSDSDSGSESDPDSGSSSGTRSGPVREVVLDAQAPWKWCAPRRIPASERAFGPAFANDLRTPPKLAVGCGRQAALATRLLRERGAQVVQILDPRLPTPLWDWVVAPAHDRLSGDNVIQVQGSLNEIDDAWLAEARAAFPALGALAGPRTAVLIGGPSAHMQFDVAALDGLCAQLDTLGVEGALMISTSRRTPLPVRERLRQRYAQRAARLWIDESDGENPYAGMLAWADRIVCTPDSVNMLSEACATRAPVYVFEPQRLSGRPRAFVDALLGTGRLRSLSAERAVHSDGFNVEPLRETARVAAILRERMDLRKRAGR